MCMLTLHSPEEILLDGVLAGGAGRPALCKGSRSSRPKTRFVGLTPMLFGWVTGVDGGSR